jgi:hypothetical protein
MAVQTPAQAGLAAAAMAGQLLLILSLAQPTQVGAVAVEQELRLAAQQAAPAS